MKRQFLILFVTILGLQTMHAASEAPTLHEAFEKDNREDFEAALNALDADSPLDSEIKKQLLSNPDQNQFSLIKAIKKTNLE
ncbi:hypothetical protein JKY79_02935 [Candidatus Babeliales bacterium]|nr:hypothetical protein [Candidatus Babeliales bacterium]